MAKLTLPAQIHPPRLKKDGSCSITFDSRELNAEEYLMIMGFRNTEGWLLFSPNEFKEIDVPKGNAGLDGKTPQQRLRSIIFVYWKKKSDKGDVIGSFETFYTEMIEKIINQISTKIDAIEN